MPTKNSLFATTEKKPTAPQIGTSSDALSIKEVSKLDPEVKKQLGKEAGFCITTDLDLSNARSIVRTNIAAKLFNTSKLMRPITLPGKSCPYDPVSVAKAANRAAADVSGLIHSLESQAAAADAALAKAQQITGSAAQIDWLKEKAGLSAEAQAVCEQLLSDCPICPAFPDVAAELELATLYNLFASITDRLISFGDPALFGMFLRCPEYMLKTSFDHLSEMAKKIVLDGQVNMLKTLVQAGNPLHLTDLKNKIRQTSKNSKRSDASTAADIDEILAASNLAKEDLIVAETFNSSSGDNTTTVYSVDNVTDMSESGTDNLASVLTEDQQKMTRATTQFLLDRSKVVKFTDMSEIPGTWQDPSGYVHIIDHVVVEQYSSSHGGNTLSRIYAHNREIRKPKPKGLPVPVLDMRVNAGTPLDLNGCAAI